MDNKIPLKKAKTTGQINVENLERRQIQEQQRKIKPGQCLKYIKVIIDPEFLSGQEGTKLLPSLLDLGVKYEVRTQKRTKIISWERSEEQSLLVKSAQELTLSAKYTPENQVLFLMHGKELIDAIKTETLKSEILNLRNLFEHEQITILIFGLKKFCKDNPNMVKMWNLEYSLTELQILYNCNCRLLESGEEVATTVSQFSKAIAEIPYKKQQSEKFSENNLFLLNDNKDCVRVEGNAGLARLWQQHLTRLRLVTLETADAIMYTYPKPRLLFKEFENQSNGENILSDLKVRRAYGPLSSDRRIGPELSRKIYTLYTSLNPNQKL